MLHLVFGAGFISALLITMALIKLYDIGVLCLGGGNRPLLRPGNPEFCQFFCRAAAVFSVILTGLGPVAAPLLSRAYTAASALQFLGFLGFGASLEYALLSRRFPQWGFKQLLPLPLAALVLFCLPLGGKLNAPLLSACFFAALAALCAAAGIFSHKEAPLRNLFFAAAALFVCLLLAALLPARPGAFFWFIPLTFYTLLEFLFFPVPARSLTPLLPFRSESSSVGVLPAGEAEAAKPRQEEPRVEMEERTGGGAAKFPGTDSGEEDLEELVPEDETLPVHTGPANPFVPQAFLDILHKNSVGELKLGDHVMQEMTVFFSDIRQFTSLLENLTPEESFRFINSYLSRIVPVISENGGFVDKYIGDAIMALFPQTDGADRAVRSAIEIQKKLLEYNEHRARLNYRPLAIGVGIHTGSLMMGVVGVEDRMQNTVISNAVNQASRLEGMCKAYNVSIVVSLEIFQKLENPGSYMYRYLGKVKTKGKAEAVKVYEIFDGINPELMERKKQANRYWEEGMLSFDKKDYSEALLKFRKVREILPEDGAAIYFHDYLLKKVVL